MVNFGSIRFLLLASALTLALPVNAARAEDALPEVEIDGSVLSDIARMQADRNLPPVQLVPPPMNDGGMMHEEPVSLTAHDEGVLPENNTPLALTEAPRADDEAKEYTPVFLSAPEEEIVQEPPAPLEEIAQEPLSSQPVFAIRERPVRETGPEPVVSQILSAPVKKLASPMPEPVPAPMMAFDAPQEITGEAAEPPAMRPALAAGAKAGIVSAPLDLPPATPVFETPRAVAAAPAKAEKKMRPVATFEMPLASPDIASAPVMPVAAEIMPPQVMQGIKDSIQAPKSAPVSFPVTVKSRTESFDPSTQKTAMAPAAEPTPAPVILAPEPVSAPVPKKKPAEITAQELPAVEKTAAATAPEEVPVPRTRPAVQTASKDFVRRARENLVETYTEAVPSNNEGNAINAKRLSVADIESDPLASQLVDMTPEEVAAALNNMAPAAGRAMAPESRSVSKPRIVRIEGERLVRQSVKNKAAAEAAAAALAVKTDKDEVAAAPAAKVEKVSMTSAAAALPVKEPAKPAEAAKPAASNLYAIAFSPGKTDVPEGENAAELVRALQADPALRVQIVAFASTDDGKEGTARRTSLSRALAVRSWLVSKGIDAVRMDVRALGLQGAGDNPDRVELILVKPKKS